MKDRLLLFFKGVAMGAANVIPGVSGGTIAFITNIYEELIHSLKSFDLKAVRLAFSFRISEFYKHVNMGFLIVLFSGVFVSIISLGKLLGFLFDFYPVYVWAYFFGLILASVYYVGKGIDRWTSGVLISMIAGTVIALLIAYLNPAGENDSYLYLIICGIVAMASMLLPGLSGSFVLILMGNYQLIFLEAVPDFNLRILVPVVLGSVLGFLLLSRVISWLLDHHRDHTIGILTGFILGSLLIIWPWKEALYLKDGDGEFILKNNEYVIEGFQWYLPSASHYQTWLAVLFILVGMISVLFIEAIAKRRKTI